MKKRMLAFLIGVLGILCVICGVILLQGQRAPETGTPVLSSSPPETAAPESAVSVSGAEKTPYVSPIDFEALQSKNPFMRGFEYRAPNSIFRWFSGRGTTPFT